MDLDVLESVVVGPHARALEALPDDVVELVEVHLVKEDLLVGGEAGGIGAVAPVHDLVGKAVAARLLAAEDAKAHPALAHELDAVAVEDLARLADVGLDRAVADGYLAGELLGGDKARALEDVLEQQAEAAVGRGQDVWLAALLTGGEKRVEGLAVAHDEVVARAALELDARAVLLERGVERGDVAAQRAVGDAEDRRELCDGGKGGACDDVENAVEPAILEHGASFTPLVTILSKRVPADQPR